MFVLVFFTIIFGACIGSFLNVVIFRLPRNKSFIINRSQCPKCFNKLNIFDLIPIFSWFLLRGRCRYCFKNISIRYPIVEIISSLLFLLCLFSNGFNYYSVPVAFNLVSGWILVSFLIVLTIIDIDTMTLPNSLTFSCSILGLLLLLLQDILINKYSELYFLEHSLALVISFLGISLFSYFLKLLMNKTVLGGGDAKLIAMSGAWLGLSGVEIVITLSFLLGGLFSLFLLLLKKIERGDYIPFGPFICLSTFLVWIYGSGFWYKLLGNIFWWKYL